MGILGRPAAGVTRRAVFLDRDGTLNEAFIRGGKSYPPDTTAEFRILPDVPLAAAALKAAGYLLIVVTNQPDVGAGRQRREVVEAMHEKLRESIPIDDIRVCYHTEADRCDCRKPAPGMILSAAADWGVELAASYMIGDRWRDIDAGRAAGCRTIFIRNRYDEPQPVAGAAVDSFGQAAALILSGAAES